MMKFNPVLDVVSIGEKNDVDLLVTMSEYYNLSKIIMKENN